MSIKPTLGSSFHLGPWMDQPSLNTVSCNGTTAHLEPKAMEGSVRLASRAGEAIPNE
jgi:hypothetical protein